MLPRRGPKAPARLDGLKNGGRSGIQGPTEPQTSRKRRVDQRSTNSDLSQLNILQTVVFSDHTLAVCIELTWSSLFRESRRR
jgi:hypothetical protein